MGSSTPEVHGYMLMLRTIFIDYVGSALLSSCQRNKRVSAVAGLPEDWERGGGVYAKGTFSNEGILPDVGVNVRLHKGL